MSRLDAVLLDACRANADRLALVDPGESLTYGDLDRASGQIASALRGSGVAHDEPVGVLVSNRARDLVALLGVWRSGAVAVPVHRGTPARAAMETLGRTGARFVVSGDAAAHPAALRGEYRESAADGAIGILDAPEPSFRPLLEGAALVIFTSGSTGAPKGVVLSHRAFSRKLVANDRRLGFGRDTTTLLVLQLTFSFGQWVSLITLMKGGTLYLAERFDPVETPELLARHRIGRIAVVPTMMRVLRPRLEEGEGDGCRAALAAAGAPRMIIAGGEPLPAHLGQRFRDLLPHAGIADVFGLTETSTSDFILHPDEYDANPGTIGRPGIGVEFRIVTPDGSEVEPGATGELEIRTPYLMNGYLDAPDLTAAALHGDYLRTGDLGRVAPGGCVELVGRSKDIVVRGGNKISPLEVEAAFLGHPAVLAALLAGVPDETMGERAHLLVVARPGAALDEAALRAWAAERLDRFKIPDRIHFGEVLPVGKTGKADRGALRELILAEAASPRP